MEPSTDNGFIFPLFDICSAKCELMSNEINASLLMYTEEQDLVVSRSSKSKKKKVQNFVWRIQFIETLSTTATGSFSSPCDATPWPSFPVTLVLLVSYSRVVTHPRSLSRLYPSLVLSSPRVLTRVVPSARRLAPTRASHHTWKWRIDQGSLFWFK